jgi:hypothetical protein
MPILVRSSIRSFKAALTILALSFCWGCSKDRPTHKPVSPVIQALTGIPKVQRFIPISNHVVPDGFLALDTQAGRLCKTWDWGLAQNSLFKKTGLDELQSCRALLGADETWILSETR